MLKAVLFDMDGVIVDSEPLHHKAYEKMFGEFDITVSMVVSSKLRAFKHGK